MKSDIDQCGDETTWDHKSCGYYGIGLTIWINVNIMITKSSEIFMINNENCCSNCSEINCHKSIQGLLFLVSKLIYQWGNDDISTGSAPCSRVTVWLKKAYTNRKFAFHFLQIF